MTRSVDIDFEFNESINVSKVLGRLIEAGLDPLYQGEVAYLIDDDGLFEWRRGEGTVLSDVVRKIDESRWRDRTVGMTLVFPDADSGGDFLFHPGRTSVSFVVAINPRPLFPSSHFCDIGWYMAKLVPLLEPLGLMGIEARDCP
ncbi:hypothetical protein [Streptomyces sp. NPDC053813]|uniref:hypothetical protein n=1 Tax=Streptomyces sp. NPDC053813 TaxID=3365717 RepID=UPI0037D7D9B5